MNSSQSERADVVTVWWCETCCSQGVIAMAADTGVYEGFQRVKDAHHEAEPDCPTDHERVRVRLPEQGPSERDIQRGHELAEEHGW